MADRRSAWCVAILMTDGRLMIHTTIAHDAAGAGVMAGIEAGRGGDGEVIAVTCMEFPSERLRTMLRLVEDDDEDKPKVVSLVSDNLRPTATEIRQRPVLSEEDAAAFQARHDEAAARVFGPALDHVAKLAAKSRRPPRRVPGDDPGDDPPGVA